MSYIEILGIPCSGKTYFKKKYNQLSDKELILKNFAKFSDVSILTKFKCYLLVFFFNNKFHRLKKLFKKKNIIKKDNKTIVYEPLKRNLITKMIDSLKINIFYRYVLNEQKKIFKVENIKIFKELINFIENLEQTKNFKERLNDAILENILIIEILKKHNNKYISDEGLLQRIFMISSISKNFEISAKYLLNYYNKFGKVIFLESRVDEIWKRSEIRKENHEGYVYKDLNQIDQEIRNFHFFKSILKNKVDLLSKDNIS